MSLFKVVSEIIRLVEDAAKIIAEGFKIFMKVSDFEIDVKNQGNFENRNLQCLL